MTPPTPPPPPPAQLTEPAPTPTPDRAVTLYWKTLHQVRITREYMQLYRDSLDRWTTRIAIGRAATGTAALAAWAVVKEHPLLWGGIIAAVQVAEGIEKATSLALRLRQTQAMLAALEEIFNQCARQWEDVRGGKLTATEILDAQLKVVETLRKADTQHLPNGLRKRRRLIRLAEGHAKTYLLETYGTVNDDVSHETLPAPPPGGPGIGGPGDPEPAPREPRPARAPRRQAAARGG